MCILNYVTFYIIIFILSSALDTNQHPVDQIVDNEDGDDNHLYIHSIPDDGTRNILLELGHKIDSHSIENEKIKIMQNLQRQLDKIQSPTKLEIVKRVMALLSPTLAAAKNRVTHELPNLPSRPPNAKISAQRRLWSTKKKANKPNNSFKRPTVKEKNETAVILLNATF